MRKYLLTEEQLKHLGVYPETVAGYECVGSYTKIELMEKSNGQLLDEDFANFAIFVEEQSRQGNTDIGNILVLFIQQKGEM